MLSQLSFGVLRRPDVQRRKTYGKPKKSSHVAAVHGIGKAVRTSLLPILYAVLRKYQAKNKTPSFNVRFQPAGFSVSSMQYSEDFGSYGSHVPGSRPNASAAEPASAAPLGDLVELGCRVKDRQLLRVLRPPTCERLVPHATLVERAAPHATPGAAAGPSAPAARAYR